MCVCVCCHYCTTKKTCQADLYTTLYRWWLVLKFQEETPTTIHVSTDSWQVRMCSYSEDREVCSVWLRLEDELRVPKML